MMKEEIDQFQAIYNTIVEFFVNYSFQLFGAIIIMMIGVFVATRLARSVEKLCLKKNIDVTLSHFLASFTKIAFIIAVAIISLGKIGISVSPFVAVIGAISLGAGLAVQGLLSNYSAGLNIILTRPFIVGDTIMVQEVTGIVTEVQLALTILTDEDGVKISIPNRHIVGEIIHNSQNHKLAESSIGIAYGSDTEKVMEVIRDSLEKHDITHSPEPLIGIDSFGDNGINFGVRFWVPTERFHEIRFQVNNSIYQAINTAGFDIPFPQREVRHLNKPQDL